jgi:hypothetical protein
VILLACHCCGEEVDEHRSPGLYINARLSVASDILTTEAAMAHLSKKDKDYAVQKARLDARLAQLKADLADLEPDEGKES